MVRFCISRTAQFCLIQPILARGLAWQVNLLLEGNEMGKEPLKSSLETGPLVESLEEILGNKEMRFSSGTSACRQNRPKEMETRLEFKCDEKDGGQGNVWEDLSSKC